MSFEKRFEKLARRLGFSGSMIPGLHRLVELVDRLHSGSSSFGGDDQHDRDKLGRRLRNDLFLVHVDDDNDLHNLVGYDFHNCLKNC